MDLVGDTSLQNGFLLRDWRGRQLGLLPVTAKVPASGSLVQPNAGRPPGHLGRSSFSGDYRLRPAPCGDFRPIPAPDLRGMKRSRRSLCQIHMLICRTFTGATGLEPATSGVTGRSWYSRAGRGQAGIPAVSRSSMHRLAGIRGRRRELAAASCGMSAG